MTNEELREVGRKAYASACVAGLKYSERKLVETAAITQAFRESTSGEIVKERDDLAIYKRDFTHHVEVLSLFFQCGSKYSNFARLGESLVDAIPRLIEDYENAKRERDNLSIAYEQAKSELEVVKKKLTTRVPLTAPTIAPSPRSPMPIKCIFCDHEAESLADLKAHSAKCEVHPLWLRLLELEGEVDAITKDRDSWREESRKNKIAAVASAETLETGSPGPLITVPKLHSGPTRAEAEAILDSLNSQNASILDQFTDWLLPQLPIERPEGVPSAGELAMSINWESFRCAATSGKPCNLGCDKAREFVIEHAFTSLAPWLRDPTGWELDVTTAEAEKAYEDARGHRTRNMYAVLDLCRSRIHPAFECKECEKKDAELRRHNDKWTGFIQRCQADAANARTNLEGE